VALTNVEVVERRIQWFVTCHTQALRVKTHPRTYMQVLVDRDGNEQDQEMALLGPGKLLQVSNVVGRGFCSLFNSYVGLMSAMEESRDLLLIGKPACASCLTWHPPANVAAQAAVNSDLSCSPTEKTLQAHGVSSAQLTMCQGWLVLLLEYSCAALWGHLSCERGMTCLIAIKEARVSVGSLDEGAAGAGSQGIAPLRAVLEWTPVQAAATAHHVTLIYLCSSPSEAAWIKVSGQG